MKEIAYCYPCATVTPVKAKLSALLADIFPGDLNTFFYTCGGAESNETAMRMARKFTGRHKIIARYRYYPVYLSLPLDHITEGLQVLWL